MPNLPETRPQAPAPKAPTLTPRRVAGSALDLVAFGGLCMLVSWLGVLTPPVDRLLACALFLLAVYAIGVITTESWIADPFVQLAGRLPLLGPGLYREDPEEGPKGLLSCPLCVGMWAGPLLAWAGIALFPISVDFWLGVRDLVMHGLVGAGGAYLLASKR